jgi:hypothetical protein
MKRWQKAGGVRGRGLFTHKVLWASALLGLTGFSGCWSRGTDPGAAGPRPGAGSEAQHSIHWEGTKRVITGQWLVVEIDGKKIPEGATITIDYRSDGELSVETSGKLDGVPALDKAKLKQYFDNFDTTNIIVGNVKITELNTLITSVDGLTVKMQRKP